MSTNTAFALSYSNPGGFFPGHSELRGLFANRELAEKALLEVVLSGRAIQAASIDELPIEQPHNPRDPQNYPRVIRALIDQKKIQAIKFLREEVSGLGLKEAKDAIEAVNLLELSQSVREAALALYPVTRDNGSSDYSAEAPQPVVEKFEPVVDWTFYTYLRDDEGDLWVHAGEGNYQLVNEAGVATTFQDQRTEEDIEDTYGIRDRDDDLDSLAGRDY